MTVKDMIIEVYEMLGDPTNWNIYNPPTAKDPDNFSLTQGGSRRILQWLNMGYKRITQWRFPDGHLVRFPELLGTLNFQTSVIMGTVEDALGTAVILETGHTADVTGWVMKILETGETRHIVRYEASTLTATVHKAWATLPDSTNTYELYKRDYRFIPENSPESAWNIPVSPVSSILIPVKIIDLDDGRELSPGSSDEAYAGSALDPGIPGAYISHGDGIRFSCPVDEDRWYQMEYMRMPEALTTPTDEPIIPELFHHAIVLWAGWYGLKLMQEHDGAYSTRRDLDHFMQTTINEGELEYERGDGTIAW